MGRKRKPGARSEKTKRLLKVRDYGNDKVQSRVEMFRKFRGDSSIGHETSCAGRLMLVGAFDGLDDPAETILSALLEYENGYWSYYGGGPRIARHERFSRSYEGGSELTPDARGEWFDSMDRRLRDAGHDARTAVHQVTVNRHWFPDEDVSWASRIINTRLAEKHLPVAGDLACDSDWLMLDLLRSGATALIGRQMRKAA